MFTSVARRCRVLKKTRLLLSICNVSAASFSVVQEDVLRAVPVMLISACLRTLFTVRVFSLLAALFYPPADPGHAVSPLGHASLVAKSMADFVDVSLMTLALLLLLRYNFLELPKLQLQPDPQVSIPSNLL